MYRWKKILILDFYILFRHFLNYAFNTLRLTNGLIYLLRFSTKHSRETTWHIFETLSDKDIIIKNWTGSKNNLNVYVTDEWSSCHYGNSFNENVLHHINFVSSLKTHKDVFNYSLQRTICLLFQKSFKWRVTN